MSSTAVGHFLADLSATAGGIAISQDSATRTLFGQDVFYQGGPVAAVVRPAATEEVQAILRLAARHSVGLVLRGGGMSYSAGYLADRPDAAVAIDLRGMNRVVEVNAADSYVIVEPGCTWAQLHDHLAPMGLRSRFWGSLSGRRATVGGGVSQNAIFWGSGRVGSAVDAVIGMEVVTGKGEVVRTGSLAVAESNGFSRHFGPDLTGLFTSDCGRLGIKTAIVLRLEPVPAIREGLSFTAPSAASLMAALGDLAREGLAAQQMGLDERLKNARLASTGLLDRLAIARQLVRGTNPLRALGQLASMALAGDGFLDGHPFSLHIFAEADGPREAKERQARIRAICRRHQCREVAPSVPRAMWAEPFPPLNGVTGPKGERWVPVHCTLPLSRAVAGHAALEAVFERHESAMQAAGIVHSWLFTTVGNHAMVIEPMFFWPDSLQPLHIDAIGQKRAARFAGAVDAPETRALVARIRQEAVEAVDAVGALHMQLGAFYPYRSRIDGGAADLLDAVLAHVDPQGRMNPQLLAK
jgi:FAD/FMN-containing dehydrogenase